MSRRAAPRRIPERAARRIPNEHGPHRAPRRHARVPRRTRPLRHRRDDRHRAARRRRADRADRQLVSSVSLAPPLVLWSLATRSPSLDAFSSAHTMRSTCWRPTSRCCRSASRPRCPTIRRCRVAARPERRAADRSATMQLICEHHQRNCGRRPRDLHRPCARLPRARDRPLIYCAGVTSPSRRWLRGRIRRRRSAERRGHRPRLVGPHDHGLLEGNAKLRVVRVADVDASAGAAFAAAKGLRARPASTRCWPTRRCKASCCARRTAARRADRRGGTGGPPRVLRKASVHVARRGAARDRRGEPASRRTRCRPRAALRAADHRGAAPGGQRRARRAAAGGR